MPSDCLTQRFIIHITYIIFGSLAVCTTMLGQAASDQPTTVTFGFHHRGASHSAGEISASSAGTTNLQNPLNNRTALVSSTNALSVNGKGLSINYAVFPARESSAGAYLVEVKELRDIRGPISLQLKDENGTTIQTLTAAGQIYDAEQNDGVLVAEIIGEAKTQAQTKGNAGGHVVVDLRKLEITDSQLSPREEPPQATRDAAGKLGVDMRMRGTFRVTPAVATGQVQMRLVQWKRDRLLLWRFGQPTPTLIYSPAGEDTAFLNQVAPIVIVNAIVGRDAEDRPGFTPTNEQTVKHLYLEMHFNTYLQYRIGQGDWRTLRKLSWTVEAQWNRRTPEDDPEITGGIINIEELATDEEPQAPPVPDNWLEDPNFPGNQ